MREPEPEAETPIGSTRAFLRDQLAAAALTGLLASGSPPPDEYIALRCWQLADMMLAAREPTTRRRQ